MVDSKPVGFNVIYHHIIIHWWKRNGISVWVRVSKWIKIIGQDEWQVDNLYVHTVSGDVRAEPWITIAQRADEQGADIFRDGYYL